MYAIYILNDDFTTFDFVIQVLRRIFNKSDEEANTIAKKVHNDGEAYVDTYTLEVAESKVYEVTALAQSQEFPLKLVLREVPTE